jgi:hypothetical protein
MGPEFTVYISLFVIGISCLSRPKPYTTPIFTIANMDVKLPIKP